MLMIIRSMIRESVAACPRSHFGTWEPRLIAFHLYPKLADRDVCRSTPISAFCTPQNAQNVCFQVYFLFSSMGASAPAAMTSHDLLNFHSV